jgi:integrase
MNNIIATIRKDKIDRKGHAPIYIHIYEGERLIAKKSIGYKIDPATWDDKARIVKSGPLAPLVNSLILRELNAATERIFAARLKGDDVRTALKGDKKRDIRFDEFVTRHIDEKGFAPETRRNYAVYTEKLLMYRAGLTIRDIDFTFLQSYEAYLRDVKKNLHNTIASNMKFIDSVMNAAIKAGIIEDSPFKVYKRPRYKQTDRVFLTAEELQRIEAKLPDLDPGLHIVAMYFLFMARTGLRYSDAVAFRPGLHIIEDERIVIMTQKTGKKTNIYINDTIEPLIRFIAVNRLHISPVDFNRKLKTLAVAAGIKKNLTSHVGRHSFGASLAGADIPIEVAKMLLSHGSTSMTRIYYHMNDKNADDAMKKIGNKKAP